MSNIYKIFLASIILFVSYGVITKLNDKGARAYRIDCHKEIVVFESVYDKEKLKKVKELIFSGNFKIKSHIRLSKYMDTQMAKYVNMEEIDKMLISKLNQNVDNKKENKEKAVIDYYVYENDKDDPGKKTPKSKLYAGYLHFDYRLNNKSIYRFQIDFMDLKGKDIEKRLNCTIKSLKSI
jgi:hypothetical protein